VAGNAVDDAKLEPDGKAGNLAVLDPKPMQQQKSWICSEQLPLKGKSALIIEYDALVAVSVEFCLLDAGAAVVKIANSIASAKSILDEGISFDVAVVDLLLADGNASTLVQVLSGVG
jgi:hypothetical protein